MLWTSSHGNFSLFPEFLKWSANESKTLSLSIQPLYGRVLLVSPWRVRVEVLSELGACACVFLADVAVSSAKNEVWVFN